MKYLEWSDKYATGIRMIDSQHQYLFTLTNRLIHELNAYQDISLSKTLQQLLDYAEEHFACEEEILKQVHYADLRNHHKMHVNLRDRIGLYSAELKQGKLSGESLVVFLRTWLEIHILKEDMKYVPAVKELAGNTYA